MKRPPLGTAAAPLELPILLRAYAEEVSAEASSPSPEPKAARRTPPLNTPSPWTFVFDTETTTDPRQRFRIGFYRLYEGDRLEAERLCIDADVLTPREVRTAELYCRRRNLPSPETLGHLRQALLRAVEIGATIVTLNGPFDISRIAIEAGPARVTRWRRKMQDGHSLRLSEDERDPRIQIKSLNSSAAFHELTAPRRNETGRSRRKREDATPVFRGFFVDVKTLAKALTARSHSLESLTEALETPTQKRARDDHGRELDFLYLDYARSDVTATHECFLALAEKYRAYGFAAPAHELVSEASVGKAALASMGLKPWQKVQPGGLDPALTSVIMSTYFGGRTEVRIRRELRRVILVDFMSMYPTICTAQGLWRFNVAEGFRVRDGTAEVRELVAQATPDHFQDLAAWPKLTALVAIRPDFDLVPVRAPFGVSARRKGSKASQATIGLNYLRYDGHVWITLADCLAAKFLSGKAPVVEEALIFEPGPVQKGLRPVSLLGRHRIDPYKQDFFCELIRARHAEELDKVGKSEAEQAEIEGRRESLKLVANATSYGTSAQVNVSREPKWAFVRVHAPNGSNFIKRMSRVEAPGPWFNPLLATLIAGGARLMLALAEHRILAEGLDWAFCDTDSMAIAMPVGMADADFEARAQAVVDWFRPLNPYGVEGSILKIETVNFSPGERSRHDPLFCWAISSKRYALFNKDAAGRPLIRKASAHGLGHLIRPYTDDDAPACFPAPLKGVLGGREKLMRWHYDVWCAILEAVLAGHPDDVAFDYHPALRRPTVSRYTASTPELLRWFSAFNNGEPYADQVKPFGFLYTLHRRRRPPQTSVPDPIAGGRREVVREVLPVAPFETDLEKAIAQAFDRVTGEPISADQLESYAEALFDYPFRSEAKFLNGDVFDRGRTERVYVEATLITLIGKEADRWEEEYYLGLRSGEMAIDYGGDLLSGNQAFIQLRNAAAAFGAANVALATGVARGTLAKIVAGKPATTAVPLERILRAVAELNWGRSRAALARDAETARLTALVIEHGGLRRAARALGCDPSNMSKRLKGRQGSCGVPDAH